MSKKAEVFPRQIQTMSDLMNSVQQDQQNVRNGSIDTEKGRLLANYHKLMLKGAELNLQFLRLRRGSHPEQELRLVASAQ